MKIANVTRLTTALVLGLTMTLALMFVVATGTLPVPVAHADDIVVSSCEASDLIAAINTANSNGADDTIILQAGCTFVLTTTYAADPDGYGPVGLPPVASSIVISGNGASISRSSSSAFRLFYVSDIGSLTLDNITLTNGLARGGNGGNAQYDGGGGGGGMGGAIFNRGLLTVQDATLTGNTALGGNGGNDNSSIPAAAGGGGMGGNGQDAPGSQLGGKGGGVNGGAGGVSGSNTGGNGGVGGGGGGAANIGGYGNGGNGGFGGGGGGGNTIAGGTGGFGGGGGGNQATGSNGGFGGGKGRQWTGGGGGGFGGAIFNNAGALTISSSTLAGNTAQGGNGTVGSATTGEGGSGYGGAIFNYYGNLTVDSSTIGTNIVIAGTGGAAGNTAGNDIYDAKINAIKTPNTTAALLGETVTYTYRIENTGTVTLTGISAQDDKLGAVAGISTTLLPGEFTIGTLTHVITTTDFHGPLVNAVVVTGTGTGGMVVTNTANASVALLEYGLTVKYAGTGSGAVAKTPDLVKYQFGDVVTLAATPAPGSSFTDWSGDLTGTTNPITISMDGDKTVTATFTLIEYNVALHVTGTGTGTATKEPDQATYHYGDVITFTATANTGSSFTGWSGDAAGITSPVTLTVDSNKIVTATFTLVEYNLALYTDGTGSGAIGKDPNQATYHYSDVVTLTANASAGSTFTAWSGDATGTTSPVTLTVDSDKAVTATFTLIDYSLTVNIVGSGAVTKQPNQPTYHYGDAVTLTATANLYWSFGGWSGDVVTTTNPLVITIDGNKNITATFKQYQIYLPFIKKSS